MNTFENMKKRVSKYAWYVCMFHVLLCCMTTHAQNLVPNPSFEQYYSCPQELFVLGIGFDTTVVDWRSGGISADYYNSCATGGSGVGVPANNVGSREPHSGNAYAGIYLYDYYVPARLVNREFVICMLQQPMQAGHQYSVSFYAGLTGTRAVNLLATDQIGVSFQLNYPSPIGMPYSVQTPGHFLSDTTGWQRFQGVYTATGGERFLTIGNFYSGSYPNSASFQIIRPSNHEPLRHSAYVYLDDVCVFDLADSNAMTTYTAADTTHCASAPLVLHAPAGSTGHRWSTGAVTDSITVADAGTYWVKSTVTCGFSIDTFHVKIVNPVRLDIGRDRTLCYGVEAVLEANHNFDQYLWNTGDTTSSIRVSRTGQYSLTVRDACGTQQDTADIIILPEVLRPQASDTSVCQYTPSPVLPVTGTAIRWYTDMGSAFSRTQPEIRTDVPGIYTWYVTQTQGACESDRLPVSVRVVAQPFVRLGQDTLLCEGVHIGIGTPEGPFEYTWNTGDTGCCITATVAGVYELNARNMCGAASDSIRITTARCEQCLWFPTAFTPNNDGRNDRFRPIVSCPLQIYRITIADRWGGVVFTSSDPSTDWDGTWQNMEAPLGTYYYHAEAVPAVPGVERILLKGDVTVIR